MQSYRFFSKWYHVGLVAALHGLCALGFSSLARAEGLGHGSEHGRMPGNPSLHGPSAYRGFQGFGLGFHPGFGYGGNGMGVGPHGGYPFYGGPGYPHPAPQLRRGCGINPFPYFGGPGHPTPNCPIYYTPVGPLSADPPVITVGSDGGYGSGYGGFTGTLPYPESAFARAITSAETTEPARSSPTASAPTTPTSASPFTAPGPNAP